MNEHPIPGFDLCQVVQGIMGREKCHGNRGRRNMRQRRRFRDEALGLGGQILTKGPVGQPNHGIADLKIGYRRADGHDDTRTLTANCRWIAWIEAKRVHNVAKVEPSSIDTQLNFVGGRRAPLGGA